MNTRLIRSFIFLLLVCTACKKDKLEDPISVPVSNLKHAVNGQNVKILWDDPDIAFDHYVIELSRDPSFSTINTTRELNSSASEYIFWKLLPAEDYHCRIKMVSKATNSESAWVTISFNTKESNILLPISSENLQGQSVTITWETFDDPPNNSSTELSKLVLKPTIGTSQEYPITSADIKNKSKVINGLQKDMMYTASIYNGNFSLGSQSFTTAAEAVNGVWTLNPYSDLSYAIRTAATGDKIILKKGIYDLSVTEPEIADKAISIEAASQDNANRPVVHLRGLLLTGLNAGITFRGLTLSGARLDNFMRELPNGQDHHYNDWLISVNPESPGINAVVMDNCNIRNYWKGIFNLNDNNRPPHKVANTLTMNNCIVTDLGGDNTSYTLAVQAGQLKEINVTNSTFYKTNKLFVLIDAERNASNVINFTFANNTVDNSWSAGAFDFKAVKAPSKALLKNNIFSNITSSANFLPNFAFTANNFDKRLINCNFYKVLSKSTIYGKNQSNMPVHSWELRHPNNRWNEVVPAFIMNDASNENPNSIKEYPVAFDPQYKDAAKGDFTVSSTSLLRQLDGNKPVGDPRWW